MRAIAIGSPERRRSTASPFTSPCWMTNQVHLLLTPRVADSLPRPMQSLGRRYVHYVNAAYPRTGTL